MALMLSDKEKILKSYEYSKITGKTGLFRKNETTSKLIVTNKRIINEHANNNGVSRSEIPVGSADYIGTYFAKKVPSLIVGILIAVLGVVLTIALAIVFTPMLVIGLILFAVGIVLIVKAVFGKAAAVVVQISSYHNEYNLMSIGSSTGIFTSSVKKIKISVDSEAAAQMVDEIGSIIIGVKDGTIA